MRERIDRVWINNTEYTKEAGVEELSRLLGKRITAKWLEDVMRPTERCMVNGVEIAMYPRSTWEEGKPGTGVEGAKKKKRLLKGNKLDLGLTKPGWMA
jgi:hypothetical protein